ncbi:hypothetical protein BH20ACT10_BH20ACT10_22440 [soil metagenome]
MKVTSHEYEGQPGMVVIELRDDIEAEYGFQVAPGMHLHYEVSDEGERIPVSIEIEVWKGLVRFEHRRDGRSRFPWRESGEPSSAAMEKSSVERRIIRA